jgi:hypothetical protein
MNARESENYLAISSKIVEIFWACRKKKNSTYCKHRFPGSTLTHSTNEDLLNIKRKGDPEVSYPTALNARASENYLAISSKIVEIFWAEIYWGRLFFRAESSLIQSSCRSYIRMYYT